MTYEMPLTATDAAARLRDGSLTSRALTEGLIARADRLDPQLGTYVTRFDEYALERADAADKELSAGIDRGPLHGIPIGVKDILAMAEGPTTANSLILDPAWGDGKDSPVVSRLKAAGAVITGKTTTNEFACGMPDKTKPFALPHNPWDLGCTTGGSSAGAGSGVAAGLFLAGIGTDTAGSIRIPAAWNGTTGLMPTFGRVPKSGCVPLCYSMDHVGPLARSARDCAEVLTVIAGYEESDASCTERPVDDYLSGLSGDLAGVRIGVDRSARFFPEFCDPLLAERFEGAVATLASLGAELVDVQLPYWDELTAAMWLTLFSDSLAYHRSDLRSRWQDYSATARVTFATGVFFSGADYVQAARVRRVVQRSLGNLFTSVDAVAMPTVAVGAPRDDGDIGKLAASVFTGYWDAVGNPALALPMGPSSGGLPLSLQLGGRPFEETMLLRIGDAFQQATAWHLQVPPIMDAV